MESKSGPNPELVQHAAAFASMVKDLKDQARVAVDTESNSLHAYRERVCLMQFSTRQRDYVLDTLALEDLAPLNALFASTGIERSFMLQNTTSSACAGTTALNSTTFSTPCRRAGYWDGKWRDLIGCWRRNSV